jgi:hypothetical protein
LLPKRKGFFVKANKRIILYGNSLILGSIGVSLCRCPQFEVTTVLEPLREMQKLDSLKPDILLFDLETTRPETVFSLLESDPNLQLIGISPDINLVKVWSIRELREVSMGDLLNVIKSKVGDSPVQSGNHENRPYRSGEIK